MKKFKYLLLLTLFAAAWAPSDIYPTIEPIHEAPPLFCRGFVQLSLSEEGATPIPPSFILSGSYTNYGIFEVEIIDPPTGDDTATCAMVGETISVMVTDTVSGNSCWANVLVQDKLAPVLSCDTLERPCGEDLFLDSLLPLFLTGVSDNCTDSADIDINYNITTVENILCDSIYAYRTERVYYAEDNSGNIAICTQTIFYVRPELDSVVFPADTTIDCPVAETGPTALGEPTAEGRPLDHSCGLFSSFTQDSFPTCGNAYKINRYWVVMDWCSGSMRRDTQEIIIQDTTGPVIFVDPADTIYTGFLDCTATYVFPSDIASDECQGDSGISYTYYLDGVIQIDTSAILDTGTYVITIETTDPCLNTSDTSYILSVIDNVAPVVSCPNATVYLNDDGEYDFCASSFSGTAEDNCDSVALAVRRSSTNCGDPGDETFGECIEFCCQDLGDTVDVIVLATDQSGNTTSCPFEVVVLDTIAPVISCPGPVDTILPPGACEILLNIDPAIAFDNCEDVTVTNDQPGGVLDTSYPEGVTSIVFTAVDPSGNSSTCTFTVTVTDTMAPAPGCSNLTVETDPAECSAVVTIPDSFFSDNCEVDTVYGILLSTGDTLLSTDTFAIGDNQVRYYASDASGNIDSCDFTISVLDNEAPLIICPNDTAVAAAADTCGRFVNIPLPTAFDNCAIDTFFNDFTNTSDASGFYPIDSTEVTYVIIDSNGNSDTCTFLVVVSDQTAPIIACQDLTVHLDSNGMDTVFIGDVLASIEDNCTDSAELFLSFSFGNPDDTIRIYDCDDVGMTEDTLFVIDASGNMASCNVTITVMDTAGICMSPFPLISGRIMASDHQYMEGVGIELYTMFVDSPQMYLSGSGGVYSTDPLNIQESYRVKPIKEDDILNGISTLDLVLMKMHILSLKPFEEPWQYIAADVNRDGRVSATDLVLLKQMLLNDIPIMSANSSWRFIDMDFEFSQGVPVLDQTIPEYIEYMPFISSDMQANFMGIKVGDVNHTAVVSASDEVVVERAEETIALNSDLKNIQAGNIEQVYLHWPGKTAVAGIDMQFTIPGSVEILNIVNTEGKKIAYKINNGKLRIIEEWIKGEGIWVTLRSEVERPVREVFKLTGESKAYKQDLQVVGLRWAEEKESLFVLYSNSPNPWSGQTEITFILPSDTKFKCEIFSSNGQMIYSRETLGLKGLNSLIIKDHHLRGHNGILYYRISTEDNSASKRMIRIE